MDHHQRALLTIMETACAAFQGQADFDFGDISFVRDMNDAGAALAADGFVPPQVAIDALYAQRKLGGTFLLAHRLKAKLPIRDMIDPFLRAQP